MFQVPIEDFKQNLLKIIDAIKLHHDNLKTQPRIILFSPPPILESLIFQYLPEHLPLRAQETTFAYSRVVMDLDVPSCVEKLDLHDAIELASGRSYQVRTSPPQSEKNETISSMEEYLLDGLHLKNPSYEIMYQLVMEAVGRRWSEITPQNMSMPVTWWGNLINKSEPRQRDEL
jgi:lysophospholipase L1-like esterase